MYRSYKYRGLIIYRNEDSEFGSEYFSVVNPALKDNNGKMFHAHCFNEAGVRKVADCFHKIIKGKYPGRYSLSIRSKAMKLAGYNIKMK